MIALLAVAAVTAISVLRRPAVGVSPPARVVDIYAFTSGSNPSAAVALLPSVVDGVSWVFRWKDIERTPGVYDWSGVDNAIRASDGSKRRTMLRIDAGAFSPSWVPNQLTFSFKPLGPQAYRTVTMPRTWDPTYVADWTGFIHAYGSRYDGDSRVTRIQMTGGGWQGEMALPQWPGWVAAGYSDSAMVNAWEQFISTYRTAFPGHQSALGVGEPLRTYYHSNVVSAVLAYALRYSRSISYQQNGLKATTSSSGKAFTTLLRLSALSTVGWQMWGGNGSSGDLHRAFATAMQSHAAYVEVYLNDCANLGNAASLAYLASGGRG